MRKFALMVIAATALISNAADHLPTGYAQVFGCELREDKSLDDIWSIADRFRDHVSGLEAVKSDPNFATFLWTPFRGALPYDFIWGVISSDLRMLGDGMSEYFATTAGPEIDADFFAASDCVSAIIHSEQLNVGSFGSTADRTPDAVVDAYQCTLNDGDDMKDVDQALDFWIEQLDKIDSDNVSSYQAWKWVPFLGGTGSWDWMIVGASPDPRTYMHGYADYLESKEGQAADARLNAVGECVNSIWTGYWVVVPQTEQ